MNKKQKSRSVIIITVITAFSVAAMLVLYALKQNINLFYTPTQLIESNIDTNQTFRVGGYVKDHSVSYSESGDRVYFTITDKTHEIEVNYRGVLPSLFREGQGVVVTGKMMGDTFVASQVLAKHDEKYMPWPLAKSLQEKST
jgi:cytochrome c-type biogenesis protein CcmE